MSVEEAQPNICEELSPSNIVTWVLSELTSQEEIPESESGDREEPGNASIVILEGNKEETLTVDEPINQSIAQIEKKKFI